MYDWFHDSSLTKSKQDFNDLIDLLSSQGFSITDIHGVRAEGLQKKIDTYDHPRGTFSAEDGWLESSVEIPLPKSKTSHASEEAAPTFQVNGVFHRRLAPMIRAAAEDTRFASQYHWIPHKRYWLPRALRRGLAQGKPRAYRVFTDMYNSNAANCEFEKIRAQPRNPADSADVEYAMFELMLWSDATHLTQFGSASLWPIYLYLGNLSKYIRGMPTEFAAHHLAYIPELPDLLSEFYVQEYGVPPSKDVLTFCKRELMSKIWLLLLDEEFMAAYKDGMLITCGDGVVRRLFPRIFSYSADYPEKILLTALKPLSTHPCPRCLVTRDHLHEAGTPQDARRRADKRLDTPGVRRKIQRARNLVFKKGRSLKSKSVGDLLNDKSLNAVQVCASAFSTRLAPFNVNFYALFVPDLMHEFELGVWKGTFIHLLRLLVAQGDATVVEFDRRMRALPTFGRDKIRKFWKNVSSRKQLAARDYEDFLIVMLPVFEGLMPLEDDQVVADMLFELANWHALAKLRLHTEVTVEIFRAATVHLTTAMRHFANTTCEAWETVELPKETDARVRREELKTSGAVPNRTRKTVAFNVLNTYKFHSLPDYPDAIEETSTSDNSNTQVCELEHRHVKRYYARTNKHGFTVQIAKHQRRAAIMRKLRECDDYVPRRERQRQDRLAHTRVHDVAHPVASPLGRDGRPDSPLPPTNPLDHHAISQTTRLSVPMRNWLARNSEDQATENFIPFLNIHLLSRMLDLPPDGTLPDPKQLDCLEIQNDRLYRHKVLRVNYTTYDLRRDQDVIKPHGHPDIMMLDEHPDAAHPFIYARVIDIFHANVRYTGPGAAHWMRQWNRMEFLWVRWFELDFEIPCGLQTRRLPNVRFFDTSAQDDVPAFGFVDPADVLRGAYILPAFNCGTTRELLGPSDLARQASDNDEDFKSYYICPFVDRDMYMRYLGGGVGHKADEDDAHHRAASAREGSPDDENEDAADPDEDEEDGVEPDEDEEDEVEPDGVDEDEAEPEWVDEDGVDEEEADEDGVDEDGVDDDDYLPDLVFASEGYAPL
ncbi:hypothetical protein C2E23DRAFT_724903 [Lenzites betulinus]|nr:hypothetical protein C2E23DRAFT_724903 [Lenzites betulinus]